MKGLGRYWSLLVLAACIAAALFFRRFVYVAWYPVLMSFAVSAGFAMSLRGRESLCQTLAKRIPPHILPDGAERYCRRYTQFWAAWLAVNGLIAVGTIYAPGPSWRLGDSGVDVPWIWVGWNCCLSYCMTGLIVLVEWWIRRRRFSAVFHTSGSTSTPKTVVKPFPTLAREVAYHVDTLRRDGVLPEAADRKAAPVFLCTIEPQHMYGQLWRVLMPRVAGCEVDGEVIRTPESLLAKMGAAERVVLVTTPSFLERFCAYADQYQVPRNCVEIITSGALLTAEAASATRRVLGLAPREIFGSTETGGVAWRRQDVPDCDWTVFDPVKVSVNAEGRLVVRSPFSFCREYAMGDGAELAADGRTFKLLGRLDRMVKINEQRVSLPEMEMKLSQLAAVKEAALVVLEGRRGPCLGAVLAMDGRPGARKSGTELLELRQRLLPIFPKGTVPKRFRFVDELPRNPQGKIVAAKLRELFDEEA